jgi:hypothetical protein
MKIIMKIRALLPKTILAAAVLLLAGCQNPVGPSNSGGSAPSGVGRVTIDLGSAVRQADRPSLTVYPGHAGLVYDYTFTKTGGAPQTLIPSGGAFSLEYGEWTVEVKAYLGAATQANLAASGAATFTVSASTQTVAVELAGVTEAGTGTFKYRIQYPQGATVTSFTLLKFPELTDSVVLGYPVTAISGGVTTITGTKGNVPAGYYFVTLMLEKDGKASGRNEVVHIYNKLASEYGTEAEPVVFTDSDFTAMTALAENTWADGNLVSYSDENWYKFTATASRHYISAQFNGTLYGESGVEVQLYDSTGNDTGSLARLHNKNLYRPWDVFLGAVYYMKVTPRGYTGTYHIRFEGVLQDTTPPSNITGLSGNPYLSNGEENTGNVKFTWTNPEDEDFDHLEITFTPSAAGVAQPIILPKTETSKDIAGLTGNVQYDFTFRTVDVAGNRSEGATIPLKIKNQFGSVERYKVVKETPPKIVPEASFLYGETEKYITVYLGRVENVPVTADPVLFYQGPGFPKPSHSSSETNAQNFTEVQSLTRLSSNTTSVSHTNSSETTLSLTGKVEAGVGVKGSIEGGIAQTWGTTSTQGTVKTNEVSRTFETARENFFSRTEMRSYTVGDNGEEPGYYRYTLFSTCDVYVILRFQRVSWMYELQEERGLVLVRPNYKWMFCYSTDENSLFDRTDTGTDKLVLDDSVITACLNYPATQSSIAPINTKYPGGIDVTGGSLTYSYEVQMGGTIQVTLWGGGGGGSGAVAVRNGGLFPDAVFTNGYASTAVSGDGASGGNTSLRLNGVPFGLISYGGAGGKGTKLTEDGTNDFLPGRDGTSAKPTKPFSLPVEEGDIITIEVGYGGGGSGGAVNNDENVDAQSENAFESEGSLPDWQFNTNCYGNSTGGGMGAMHSLRPLYADTGYPNLEKGEDSQYAGPNAGSALGGQSRGQGGAAGIGSSGSKANGNVYASGGGGGAAGGFTLTSTDAAIIEKQLP